MKTHAIIAVVLTGIGIYIICLTLKAWKGLKIKCGGGGMVLLLMPHSLGIVTFPEHHGYFIATLIGSILGVFLFACDMPRLERRNQPRESD